MPEARLVKALVHLRTQINSLSPNRDKSSDGWIGDTSHQARKSDHNPDEHGNVYAIDISHDPANGVDSEKLAEELRTAKDPRLQYVISNRKIANMDIQGGAWRPYTGSNPHNHHCHISARHNPALCESEKDWRLPAFPAVALAPQAPKSPTVRRGVDNVVTNELKLDLNKLVLKEKGFGVLTEALVKAFQHQHGLVEDGIVGTYTWTVIKGEVG